MPAKIWTISNQKGGAGKTNVSMCLAGGLAAMGFKVLVADADKQGTATQWAASAEEGSPFPATVTNMAHAGAKLHQLIRPMINDYDHILVDCPPSVEEQASQSALIVSDICIVPIQPTPTDLWATIGIVKLIRNIADLHNPELKSFAVANRVSRRKFSQDVLSLVEQQGIALLDSRLTDKTAYEQAPMLGSHPIAMGKAHKAAADEVENLLIEIFGKMGWANGN